MNKRIRLRTRVRNLLEEEICEILYTNFQSVFTKDSTLEISEFLQTPKNKKADGPDKIFNWVSR